MSAADTLRSGGQRVKVHDAQAVFKLPSAAKQLAITIAEKGGTSEGAVYREALAEYFERRGYRS